jgi:hypothetical protein
VDTVASQDDQIPNAKALREAVEKLLEEISNKLKES